MTRGNFTLPSQGEIQSLLSVATRILYNSPPYNMTLQSLISKLLFSPNITDVNAQIGPLIAPRPVYPTLHTLHDMFLALPNDDDSHSVVIGEMIIIALAYPVVLLRLLVRLFVTPKALWLEDWMCVAALLCASVHTGGIATELIWSHAGHHIWALCAEDIRRYQLMNVINEYCFILTHIFVKLSFLTFYHRLSREKYYRWATYAIASFVLLLSIITIAVVIFQCEPLDWWNHLATAKCIDRIPALTVHGVGMILADVSILCVPMYIVVKVSLKTREKILLVFVFGLGGAVTVISILRVIAMLRWLKSADQTYGINRHCRWIVLEVVLSIIVCCAPALKTLVTYRGDREGETRISKLAERLSVTFARGGLAKPGISTRDGEMRRQRCNEIRRNRSDGIARKDVARMLSQRVPSLITQLPVAHGVEGLDHSESSSGRGASSNKSLELVRSSDYSSREELGVLPQPGLERVENRAKESRG